MRGLAILMIICHSVRADGIFRATTPRAASETVQEVAEQSICDSAVRPKLYITTAVFHCPPCAVLKRDIDAGRLDQFEIRLAKPFDGMKSYPAIRFQNSAGEWKVVYGYNETIRLFLVRELVPRAPALPPVVSWGPVSRNPSLFGRVGTSHESRETLIKHLLHDGIHRGRRTIDRLQAMSDDELDAAHAADHR